MSRRRTRQWPDYMMRETLAERLDVAPGCIDQLVKRGILPGPRDFGGIERWRWDDVDTRIIRLDEGGKTRVDEEDPYLAGIWRGPTEEANH